MANEDFITKADLNEALAKLEAKLAKESESRMSATDGRVSKLTQTMDGSQKTVIEMEQLLPKIKQVVEPSKDEASGEEPSGDLNGIKSQLTDVLAKMDAMTGDMLTSDARIKRIEESLSPIIDLGVIDASMIEVEELDLATIK